MCRLRSGRLTLILLIGYTLLLSYWMFFGFGRIAQAKCSCNLVPFSTIRYFIVSENLGLQQKIINLAGNIFVFVPFGILLPLLFSRLKKNLIVFWTGLFILESLQYVSKRGTFDIDDFILNTVGFLLGYLFLFLFNKRR